MLFSEYTLSFFDGRQKRPSSPLARMVILVLVGVFVLGGCQSPESSTVDRENEEAALRQLLQDQQAAWNRGDLEAFMAGYAKTDTLRFASGGNVRTGWQETLDSYRRGYPDRAAMGTLTFDQLDIEVMTAGWAMIFGRWALERESDRPSGLFTLIAHRPAPDAEWRIVHDHTSSAPAEENPEEGEEATE